MRKAVATVGKTKAVVVLNRLRRNTSMNKGIMIEAKGIIRDKRSKRMRKYFKL